MPLKRLKPFDGLSVLTSEMDEIEVAHLLGGDKKNLSLTCQDCGGSRFKVQAFIPAELDILTGKHTVITHVDYKKVVVNRVVRCVHCDSTDFVMITEPEENKDGQKHSSIG